MKISVPACSPLLENHFTFGVATAALQIEGGAEYRQPCNWDAFCQQPGAIADGSNVQVACDHYSNWQADIDMIEKLNVDAYRLSLSWPRIMNADGSLNHDGLGFYKKILTLLKDKNIKAYVTLYHWDLPLILEQQGGWTNRQTAYKFRDYVEMVCQELKGLVHSYATLNEPFCSAYLGYEIGMHAPGDKSVQHGRQAAHHLLLAHGLGMEVLRKHSPDTENGIVLNMSPCYPATDDSKDIKAAKDADDFLFQWYAKPILDGQYPDLIEELPLEFHPEIMEGDMDLIAGPIDFIGLNYYTREVYHHTDDALFKKLEQPSHPLTDMGWEIYPQGLMDLLLDLNRRYQLPPVYITENGAAMPDVKTSDGIHDLARCHYLQDHIMAVHHAVDAGVDIRGYFAWSLMDNFEWSFGYEKRFGIVYVDYATQERTIKDSGLAYARFLADRHMDQNTPKEHSA